MKKKPRVNKSKEELIKEQENRTEVARKKDIIVNKFYPALVNATVSVDESKALINAMSTLLMEEVLKTMRERKFIEIMDIIAVKLCPDDKRVIEITELLSTLENENLFVAREIIEGMTRAIEAMITEEMRERNLDSLTPNWDKYLNG